METDDITPNAALWIPMSHPIDIAHLGKLAEEINECGAIIARILIQGIDSLDPDTGKVNRAALQDELADVQAMSALVVRHFLLSCKDMDIRVQRKMRMKEDWHRQLEEHRKEAR